MLSRTTPPLVRLLDLRHSLSYAASLDLQREIQASIVEKKTTAAPAASTHDDTLILLEYDEPIYTVGRSSLKESTNILDPNLVLNKVERGGEVTYHGPGQLVGYVVLDLERVPPFKRDLKWFLGRVEEVVIQALARGWGIRDAARVEGRTGVWVSRGGTDVKLAAIGIGVRRWVTIHGFALNVDRQALAGFSRIHPCGIPRDEAVTVGCANDYPETRTTKSSRDIDQVRGLTMDEAKKAVAEAFESVFEVKLVRGDDDVSLGR